MVPGFAFFATAIGECAVVWSHLGIKGVTLPHTAQSTTRADLLRRFRGVGGAPMPVPVAQAAQRMTALMDGDADDLRDIALDLSASAAFEQRVYEIARAITPGHTRTYGQIARELGDLNLSRAVGQALGANPCPIIVPCHRVLASGGKTGGFSAPGGVATKARMLSIERAQLSDAPLLFDDLPVVFATRQN